MPGPVLTLHSPVPPIMGGVWSILRETLLAGMVDRTDKELVAATVSKLNECPFCVDAHSTLLHAIGEHELVDAILRGDFAKIHQPRQQQLVQWLFIKTDVLGKTRLPVPFSPEEAPEILGTALTFHYINRMANVFLGDGLLPLPSALKGVSQRVLGATVSKRMVRTLQPGHSLRFVPAAELPVDLLWAQPNEVVARSLAGFTRIVEEAGLAALPAEVRTLVLERIQHWQGEPMGLSRRWVEEAVAPLSVPHRALARLTLLVALASYQVDEQIIAAAQADGADDQRLIQATAWASFMAARRATLWLAEPFTEGLQNKEVQDR